LTKATAKNGEDARALVQNSDRLWSKDDSDREANFVTEHQTNHRDRTVQGVTDSDAILAHEVKQALLRGTESAGIEIHVRVDGGTVWLSGVVDVLSHRASAEEIARRIPGVRRIENDITVANEEQISDKHLMELVNERLVRTPFGEGIGCRVHRGVVTLVGRAKTNDGVDAAIRFVQDIQGVREVRTERIHVGEHRKEDDADVSRAAEHLLDALGYDHRLFEVYCADGVLHVKGFVPTREDKSRIKTEMHKIPGAHQLESLLVPEDRLMNDAH